MKTAYASGIGLRELAALTATPVEAVAMTMQEGAERRVQRMAGISERGIDHIETMFTIRTIVH